MTIPSDLSHLAMPIKNRLVGEAEVTPPLNEKSSFTGKRSGAKHPDDRADYCLEKYKEMYRFFTIYLHI